MPRHYDRSSQPDEGHHAARQPDDAGAEHEAAGAAQAAAPYSAALPAAARASGRGTAPARSAALQRLQQTAGNRAVQRFIQRAATSAPPRPAADVAGRIAAAGSGSRLESHVQRRLETGLGADLSGVQVHTDGEADHLARAVDAVAFTTGQDIFFRAGAYNPDSSEGLHLLAHEATHTVQQAAGPVAGTPTTGGLTISDPGDSFEQAAGRTADSVAASAQAAETGAHAAPASTAHGGGAAVQRQPTPGPAAGGLAVQRFGSEEHRQLGAEGSGDATLDIDLGEGTHLTYGEMVALAGDYFQSIGEVRTLAATPGGQAQLRWARWWALHIGSEPAVDESVKAAVRDRYYRLAAGNISHFSAGGTARNEYERVHQEALAAAFLAGATGDSAKWAEAMATEAFSNHYLTDMFSAGHVRTPRAGIKHWYTEHYPHSVGSFVSFTAHWITGDLDQRGEIPWYLPNFMVENSLYSKINELGGSAIAGFSIGDLVSLALHNHDNAGLNVVSNVDAQGQAAPGGHHWRAVGDDHLAGSPETRGMAVAAVRASLHDLSTVRAAGQQAGGGHALPPAQLAAASSAAVAAVQPFAAEAFVPREDTSAGNQPIAGSGGSDAATPANALNWRWGEMDPVLHDQLDRDVRTTVVNTLRDKAGMVPEVVEKAGATLHTRRSFLAYCDYLAQEGIRVIELALVAPASPPPVDDSVLDGGSLPGGVPMPATDGGTGGDPADAGVPDRTRSGGSD
jgi:hypothetical protein